MSAHITTAKDQGSLLPGRGSMRPIRFSDGLVDEIAGNIISGRLTAGTVLPSESQLCEHYQVSRTVVREAMSRLAREGLVQVRQGHGTVVLDRTHWQDLSDEVLRIRAAHGLIGDLVPDLLAIRRLIEIEVAGLAAERRGEEDLARLAALLSIMDEARENPATYNDADLAFHEALTIAARNELLRQMIRPINQVRRISTAMVFLDGKVVPQVSVAGHHEIFDAVMRQDASAARDAMMRHIAQFERDMSEVASR